MSELIETRDKIDTDSDINWDLSIRLQVSEMICEFHSACENGEINPPNHNRLRGVYPTIAYDEEVSPHPILLSIHIPILSSGTIHYRYDWQELPLSMNQALADIQDSEGFDFEDVGRVFSPEELLFEARKALTITPADVEFAKKHGWVELMLQVQQGKRSTHRLITQKLAHYIVANKRAERRQRRQEKRKQYSSKNDERDSFD
jgi:hypothetical protein